jgi:hypothetical protein
MAVVVTKEITMGNGQEDYDAEYEQDDDDKDEYEANLVFVIMPFSEELEESYFAIKDECSRLGLNAKRVDENVGAGLIIDEVTDFIESAEFIICDLTKERPNVYYELGYAHGVGNEPLDLFLIAKEGTVLHFDIAPYRVYYYRSTEHLRSLIRSKFAVMVKENRDEAE